MTDADLVQIVDSALADVARRSGEHLVCRPGCAQCCIGVFSINALDVERLRRGYAELQELDPARSLRVQQRVQGYVARTAADYPGDPHSGSLDESAEAHARFEDFANDEVCPVLDPLTLTCDLYEHRPMTCRVFGPPVRAESVAEDATDSGIPSDPGGGLGICELCFTAATPEEIADCELIADPDHLEDILVEEQIRDGASRSQSTVAYALSTYLMARNGAEATYLGG